MRTFLKAAYSLSEFKKCFRYSFRIFTIHYVEIQINTVLYCIIRYSIFYIPTVYDSKLYKASRKIDDKQIFTPLLLYEVGSKQYETAKISRQLRPIDELCIHNNGRLLHKLEIAFSSHHPLATGLGSRAERS
jgi:hypothetical protein